MDGMNLVSKEGPAINARDGVLVLSPQAGSFEELGDMSVAIGDALDVGSTADALEVAIEMAGDERARKATKLRTSIEARTPNDWIESQIDDLTEVQEGREPKTAPCDWG
jgi:trehalose 6-phosphate synthase